MGGGREMGGGEKRRGEERGIGRGGIEVYYYYYAFIY